MLKPLNILKLKVIFKFIEVIEVIEVILFYAVTWDWLFIPHTVVTTELHSFSISFMDTT